MWSSEAPMPRQTNPIEKNMSALNSRMKLTSWNLGLGLEVRVRVRVRVRG